MAHNCPVCGCKCTCGGDIDDIIFPDTRDEASCTCCDDQDFYCDDDADAEIENEYLQEAIHGKS